MSESSDIDVNRYPDKEEGEVYGVVTEMLGANRLNVRCIDGEERQCRIPGSMQKREWIREDDLVIVDPWDFQDEKGDVAYRYERQAAEELRDSGKLVDFEETGDA